MSLYINRFIYRLLEFFRVVLLRLCGFIFTKTKTIRKKHHYKFLYSELTSSNKYRVVYDCTICHQHKVIFLSKEEFIELKNKNFKI